MTDAGVVMSAHDLTEFLAAAFADSPRAYLVDDVDADGLTMHIPAAAAQIRPGGTVSGPTMMSLADAAAWLVTLSRIGPVALAVTSNLTINFLSKPQPGDLFARARLLRLGRRQSVSEVRLWSEGGTVEDPVAHATVTYSIPQGGG